MELAARVLKGEVALVVSVAGETPVLRQDRRLQAAGQNRTCREESKITGLLFHTLTHSFIHDYLSAKRTPRK